MIDDPSYEDDEDDECEIMKSLEKDYNDFMNWSLGTCVDKKLSKKTAVKIWMKLHPELEVPRVFRSEHSISSELATICLFLDVYPLYLAEKKK